MVRHVHIGAKGCLPRFGAHAKDPLPSILSSLALTISPRLIPESGVDRSIQWLWNESRTNQLIPGGFMGPRPNQTGWAPEDIRRPNEIHFTQRKRTRRCYLLRRAAPDAIPYLESHTTNYGAISALDGVKWTCFCIRSRCPSYTP